MELDSRPGELARCGNAIGAEKLYLYGMPEPKRGEMTSGAIDDLPGFRRRITIAPMLGNVRAEVEDDFHHMLVTVSHEAGAATKVDGEIIRAPWTTCPGATVALDRTFTGLRLEAFAKSGPAKPSNCTHLFDLAQWAAAHASDTAPTLYEVLTSDPVNGETQTELRRNGTAMFRWTLANHTITEPPELAGRTLMELNDWLATLPPAEREAARILRWASLVAHGRNIPLAAQSDAKQMMMGSCFTFQPETAKRAVRVGEIRELSGHGIHPLLREKTP